MKTDVHFSSETTEWTTPQELYDELDAEFGFVLDPCATDENHKCENYYTKEDDGLAQRWKGPVFMNPPYSRGMTPWIKKASECEELVVGLLPARTSNAWFHDYIYGRAEIRFIRGRVKFGGAKTGAPFPSMIVVWRP